MKLLILSALLLSSCGGGYFERQEKAKQDEVIRLGEQANQAPTQTAYNEGVKHGCSSGYNTGGDWTSAFQKDIDKYVKDEYYKTGWNDGFTKCKGIADLAGQSIDNSLQTAPLSIP